MPDVGIVAFASVVVLAMIAALVFDPGLMWDAAGPTMSDDPNDAPANPELAQAAVGGKRRFSVVWLIAIVAAIAGVCRGDAGWCGDGDVGAGR